MVPVQQLMVKAMSELGISRSFYKGPDEQGQGSHFHIKEAKSTIPCVSVQNSFVWFLKLVLIQPPFDLTIDEIDILGSEVH